MDRDRLSELMASPDLSLAFDTPIFKAIAGQLPKCMEMSSATQCSNKLAEHLIAFSKLVSEDSRRAVTGIHSALPPC